MPSQRSDFISVESEEYGKRGVWRMWSGENKEVFLGGGREKHQQIGFAYFSSTRLQIFQVYGQSFSLFHVKN